MEASIAGQQAAGDGGGEGTEAAQAALSPDQLAEQFSRLEGGQEELRQLLQSQIQAPAEPAAQEAQEPVDPFGDIDLSFLDPSEPGYNPEQIADKLGGLIDQVAEARAQQITQPIVQRLDSIESKTAEDRIKAESRDLVAEFPELGDEKVANEVVGAAQQIAEAYGQPELANEPWFWRMTYMAGQAAELANQEGREGPAAAHLEGGGGAMPAGSQQVDLGEQIVSAQRGGRGVLPF